MDTFPGLQPPFGPDSGGDDDDDGSATLQSLRQLMRDGFRGVNKRVEALGNRVAKLESDSVNWARVKLIAKALVPFGIGLLAQYVPSAARAVPAILDAIARAQAQQ